MSAFRAILFDLFGTVALLDAQKLPIFEWHGQSTRSTTAALRAIYEQRVTEVPFTEFFAAMTAVLNELADTRAQYFREMSCLQRFWLTLIRAGLRDCEPTRSLAEELALLHTTIIARTAIIPPAHAQLLKQVSGKYFVGLVSNYDHGPSARGILHTGGVDNYFSHIAISEEHGWCKPHPAIFQDALAALGVPPEQALFVGDSPSDDVAGAKRVGMSAVWVNPHDLPLPRGIPVPDYTVRAIPELAYLLF